MAYNIDIKLKAISLRKKGYSIKEIASTFNIAKSTSSLWCSTIMLNSKAQQRLQKRQILGQYKAMQTVLKKRRSKDQERLKLTKDLLSNIELTKEHLKLLCSLIYWCEGYKKDDTYIRFINSDPSLIKVFLHLLRNSFEVDESKFRIGMHLHEYHNEKRQKEFWSEITNIPTTQFNKTYLKPHTGKRIRESYPGCISLSYYNANIAREIQAIYNAYASLRA